MSDYTRDRSVDCLIIGAGISGLMAARSLTASGLEVLLLDKGRSVGGRMATRRKEPYRFDHGAQAVFPTDPRMQEQISKWLTDGVACKCLYPHKGNAGSQETSPICGVGGISGLAKSLASDLNVETACRVTRVSYEDSLWRVQSEAGTTYSARSLMLTAPMPQSLELLHNGDITLPETVLADLAAITYDPCIAVMAIYDTSAYLMPGGFVRPENSRLSLIIDNYAKGVSETPGAVTLLTTTDFASRHWDTPAKEMSEILTRAAEQYITGAPSQVIVHKWRYNRTRVSHPQQYALVEHPGLLAFAGDGFRGKDIEGAALSGIAAAEAIREKLR